MSACECSENEVCVFCVAGKVDVIRDESSNQTILKLAEALAHWNELPENIAWQTINAMIGGESKTAKDIAVALRSLLQGGGK